MKLFKLLATVLVAAMMTGSAWAQLTTAAIVGTITDTTGAVIPGTTVTAVNDDTHFTRSTTTGGDGSYRLEYLPIGHYSVSISHPGFTGIEQKNVVLVLNQEQNLSPALTSGSTNTEITVTSAPPMIQTTVSSVGRNITNVEVDNLPLVNRNVYDLMLLAPGVQSSTNNIALGIPQQVVYINGGMDNELGGNVSFYLDGGINMTFLRNSGNPLPNPDALQEVNVMTSTYDARYGRASSGVINTVTKSGTNTLHGSVFEFVRNDRLNATNYSNYLVAQTGTQHYHRNQFGATLGGPVSIPHLYNGKDKTFFFGSYGGFRQNTPTPLRNIPVPSQAERNSGFTDFSDRFPGGVMPTGPCATTAPAAPALTLCMPNPNTYLANPANGASDADQTPVYIPGYNLHNVVGVPLDTTAINVLTNFVPAPNFVSPTGPTWTGNFQQPQQEDEYLVKINHNLTSRQRIDASYFQAIGYIIQNPGGNFPNFWSHSYYPYRSQDSNLSHTWTVSDRKVNQVWLNYTRMIGGRDNLPATSLGSLGSAFQVVGTPSLPQLAVTGFFTLGEAISGPLVGTNFYGFRDVFSWTKGKHTLAFGGEANLEKDMQNTTLNNYGVFTFATGTTTIPPSTTKICERTCNGLTDFVLGLNSAVNQDTGLYIVDNTFQYGLFVQDDWKIRQNLTLNLGMRWDIQTPPTDPQNRESAWRPGVQSVINPLLPTGLNIVGDPGLTRGIVTTRWHHVSPRAGFAWDVFGNGKTAVRGAGGLFYGIVSGNLWNASSNFAPFATRSGFGSKFIYTLTDPYHKFAGGVSPFNNPANFVPSATFPNNIEAIDPNYQWPYTYQWNLAVQQQITKDFSITVSYIGSATHHVPFDTNANPECTGTGPSPGGGVCTATAADAKRPLFATQHLQNVYVITAGQTGNYNALQFEFDKRLSSHISLKGSYVWSRTMESASNQNTTAQNNPQNFEFIREDKGRADDDIRNRFVTSVVWKPDYFTSYNRLVRGTLNGWTIASSIYVQSGVPITVTTGSDTNQDGNSSDRVSIVPGLRPYASYSNRGQEVAGYLNKNAFCIPGAALTAAQGTGTCPGISGLTGAQSLDGNMQRDSLSGPGMKQVNMSLFRDFPVYGRVKLQFRAEANNVFNFVNLGNPGSLVITAATFGQITGIYGGGAANTPVGSGPRVIQLGGRLLF